MCPFKSILKLDSQGKEVLPLVTTSAEVHLFPEETIGQLQALGLQTPNCCRDAVP